MAPAAGAFAMIRRVLFSFHDPHKLFKKPRVFVRQVRVFRVQKFDTFFLEEQFCFKSEAHKLF